MKTPQSKIPQPKLSSPSLLKDQSKVRALQNFAKQSYTADTPSRIPVRSLHSTFHERCKTQQALGNDKKFVMERPADSMKREKVTHLCDSETTEKEEEMESELSTENFDVVSRSKDENIETPSRRIRSSTPGRSSAKASPNPYDLWMERPEFRVDRWTKSLHSYSSDEEDENLQPSSGLISDSPLSADKEAVMGESVGNRLLQFESLDMSPNSTLPYSMSPGVENLNFSSSEDGERMTRSDTTLSVSTKKKKRPLRELSRSPNASNLPGLPESGKKPKLLVPTIVEMPETVSPEGSREGRENLYTSTASTTEQSEIHNTSETEARSYGDENICKDGIEKDLLDVLDAKYKARVSSRPVVSLNLDEERRLKHAFELSTNRAAHWQNVQRFTHLR